MTSVTWFPLLGNLKFLQDATWKQRYKRTRMVLPVRVWLDDSTDQSANAQLAHTLDITQVGAMVGGLHSSFNSGDNVVVQRGQFKARFRVVWTKQLGHGEVRTGIEAVDPDPNIWGVDLPPELLIRVAMPRAAKARPHPLRKRKLRR